jgi:hypothetical protein
MDTNRPLLVSLVFATFIALTACSPTPTPRGSANQGVGTGDTRPQNVGYYLGGDPDHRLGSKGSP